MRIRPPFSDLGALKDQRGNCSHVNKHPDKSSSAAIVGGK